jgi:competence protein ComEC
MTKSNRFFVFCAAFLLGIVIGEVFTLSLLLSICFLVCLLFFLIAMLFVKMTQPRSYFVVLVLILIVLGVFVRAQANPQITEEHISFYNDQQIEFEAIVNQEPDVRLDKQKLTVEPVNYKGKVLLGLALYPEYEYGDRLQVKCRLQAPEPIEDFKYDRYLSRYNIYSLCYRPYIKVLGKDQGSYLVGKVFKIKKKVETSINRTLAEPQAALTAGILLGSRQGIPSVLLEKFNITGITHIIAISGYNITIIVVLLMNLGKHLYINRKKMIWLILIGLLFFVILTGASASVVRAAIMGMIVVLAKHLGRIGKISNVLIFSAVLMVIVNPKILIWDAGFQLSFLATIGLVYLSPRLLPLFKWVPKKMALQENFVSTLSAIIFTLPLILFSFQRLSIVAPLVNLLVLPVIPISMLFGFVMFLSSLVHTFFGQVIGWFTWLLLKYVVEVVELFASFSWASVEVSLSWWMMFLLYIGLFYLILRKKH